MTEPITMQGLLAMFTARMLEDAARAIEKLALDELHFRPGDNCNSIGFDAWHVARTADNVIHFAFEREQPVWLAQGLDEAWGLPKVEQGTGMDPADAHALRFPEPRLLAGYVRDVSSAVASRIEAMSDDYIQGTATIRPRGELRRAEIIGQVLIAHGNEHLGQMNIGLTLLGKPGLDI